MDSNSITATDNQKMVFVVNTSLGMGRGKMAAQVGHAALAVYKLALQSESGRQALNHWESHGETKIVLRGTNVSQLMELFQQAQRNGLFAQLIIDAGRTQVPPDSCTMLGIFGASDAVDKVTGQLKLLN